MKKILFFFCITICTITFTSTASDSPWKILTQNNNGHNNQYEEYQKQTQAQLNRIEQTLQELTNRYNQDMVAMQQKIDILSQKTERMAESQEQHRVRINDIYDWIEKMRKFCSDKLLPQKTRQKQEEIYYYYPDDYYSPTSSIDNSNYSFGYNHSYSPTAGCST